MAIISFMLSFSGFSIIFQIYSCIYKIPIKLWHLVKNKLLQGILSGIITYILLNILNNSDNLNFNMITFNTTSYFIILVSLLFTFVFTLKKVTRK